MYLFEICHVDISDSLWDIILSLLVIMCIVINPVLLLLKIPFATYQIPFGSQARIPVLGIVIIVLYLRMLSIKSSDIKSAKKLDDEIGIFTKEHINVLIEIVVNYGVVIMALMSAYGAVWCPYIYFNHTDSKSKWAVIQGMILFRPRKSLRKKFSTLLTKSKRIKGTSWNLMREKKSC